MNFITHWLKVHFILAIVKQLTFWLSIILVYCLVVYGIERYFEIRTGEMGGELALIQTIILSLLMSFRNRSAYERWWEGRKLWGQLVNDSRNLAIKLKAYVPRDVLEQSGIKNLLVAFPMSC
jgi:putative membrane protein